MQNYNDDDDWDDLDDYALEQCVLKENEILSQNPELCKNVLLQSSVSKGISPHWINSDFNSFVEIPHTSKAESNKFSVTNLISEKQTSGSLSFSRSNSIASTKKSYKPLHIGSSSSSVTSNENNNKLTGNIDIKSLQSQLEQVLKEKKKLQEENLVKQGEVAKTVNDLELKVKKLEREIDRFEGNILFKNREIDELLAKCKQSNTQTSSSAHLKPKCNSSSPSPKKRKLDNYHSPTKSSFNFADRFDFGERKVVKNVQVQTEKELRIQNRLRFQITSSKGIITANYLPFIYFSEGSVSGSRKAFYLLSNHKRKETFLSHQNNSVKENNIISHLISSVESTHKTNLNNSEQQLIKHICHNLENLLKAKHLKGNVSKMEEEKLEENFLSSSIPLLKMLNIMKTCNKNIIQNEVKILALFIEEFLKDKTKNISGIISSLDSLSSILSSSSELTQEMCTSIVESLNMCCQVYSIDILFRIISTLISGTSHEIFKCKICTHTAGNCLLNSFCNMVWKVSDMKPENFIHEMAILISKLLHEPSALVSNSSCSCSFSLLTVFINNLQSVVKNITKDEDWHRVFSGLKVLHAWQRKDKHLFERASQLSTFPVLLSAVTKKAKLLKSKGILDNFTWELIYEVYEIDESS
ncbi:hypothetical protein Anas_11438 [Armadillidium nasatum]|uniref:Uncharacterized protein n=1 Tax=Armadillidium nasatum TaxID=96803 RepID=A0A5N5T6Y2_9CRUS|nr:hypothetical protein Anas_11438 [Armadillidium nasatum]